VAKMVGVMQEVLFEGVESQKKSGYFQKQRGRWTRNQIRVIEILADPLNALLTNQAIAEAVGLSERHIYRLQSDSNFLAEVEKRRKSDETIIRLRARVWKALFHQIEKSPAKIRTALEALGDLKPIAVQNLLQVYEKLDDKEVDERLEKVMQDRKRVYEFSQVDN